MQTILIFQEKYGNRYFDASTDEARLKAFYSILKERAAQGYFYHAPESIESQLSYYLRDGKDEYLTIPDEVLVTLPEAIWAEVKKLRGIKAEIERNYNQELAWYNLLQQVISIPFEEAVKLTNSCPSHLKPGKEIVTYVIEGVIQYRASGEYEGYDFETLEDPKT